MRTTFWLERLNGRDQSEDQDVEDGVEETDCGGVG
jgi:hypothetical protein